MPVRNTARKTKTASDPKRAVAGKKIRRKPVRRQPDEGKHEAILKAAGKLFLKHGYASTTMDDVALAARVTKQTVYAHYQSKDVLFSQMIQCLCQKYTPSPLSFYDPAQKVETLLAQIGLSYLNMMTSPDGLAAVRLVVSEAKRHPRMAQLFHESSTQRMIQLLAALLRQHSRQLPVANPESAASHFYAMLMGRYYQRMILCLKPAPAPKDKEAHVRETVRMFMALYGGRKLLQERLR